MAKLTLLDIIMSNLPASVETNGSLSACDKLVAAFIWDKFKNTPAKYTGVVMCTEKTMAVSLGLDMDSVKASIRKLDETGLIKYTTGKHWKKGEKPSTSTYTVNVDSWSSTINGDLTEDVFTKITNNVFFNLNDESGGKDVSRLYNDWGSNFKSKEHQLEAVRLQFRYMLKNSVHLKITDRLVLMDNTKDYLIDMNKKTWKNQNAVSEIYNKHQQSREYIESKVGA